MELAEDYDFIYAVVGWHPVDAIDMTEEDLAWIEELAAPSKSCRTRRNGFGLSLGQIPKRNSKGSIPKTNAVSEKSKLADYYS